MAEKVRLNDQIRAVNRAVEELARLYGQSDFHQMYPTVLGFETDALSAAARTLEFMQAHEQTIRDAISSARALDAAQNVP